MPDRGEYNESMDAYWSGERWVPQEEIDGIDLYEGMQNPIPPAPWWKRVVWAFYAALAVVLSVGVLGGTCYGLSQIPGCKSIPVSDAEVRKDARKLGKKVLNCKNVKVYITGKWSDWAYVAVVGCKKKVMFRCLTRAGHRKRGCVQESDVMPGTQLNVRRRHNGTGKFHSESWELLP